MAQKRMFNLSVVDTDKFLEMPISAQSLYFHLGMRADDDGFIDSPKRITALVGCNMDDIKVLVSKGYLIPFESGVIVVTHWRINNALRADRLHPTVYQSELNRLTLKDSIYTLDNQLSTNCQPTDNQLTTNCQPSIVEYSIDKSSIDKSSIDKSSIDIHTSTQALPRKRAPQIDYKSITDMYNDTCISLPRLIKLTDKRKKAIKSVLNTYSVDDVQKAFKLAQNSEFLTGRSGSRWKASFDWLMNTSNLTKVLEGNYTIDRDTSTTNADRANLNDRSKDEELQAYYEKLLYEDDRGVKSE